MIRIAVILLILGLFFFCIEGFIPGFGFFGITGFILVLSSAVYSALCLPYGYYIASGELLLIVGGGAFVLNYIKRNKDSIPVILSETLNEDTDITDYNRYVGMKAKTKTPLKPFGYIEIDGEYIEAYAENTFISGGKEVVCKYVNDGKLYVRQV